MGHWNFNTNICREGNCQCNCINNQTGEISELMWDGRTCNTNNDCTGDNALACMTMCYELDHEFFGTQSLPPQQLGRRRPGTGPYTPGRGRGRRGRGYNRGGRVNTNRSRFSGRTQNNPKGKPKK